MKLPPAPQVQGGDSGGRKGVPGGLAIGTGQAAGSQQDAAEIPSDHAAHIANALPLKDIEHRLARRTLGLPVVTIAQDGIAQDVAPAVVPGVVVFLFSGADALLGLLLGGDGPDLADEAGALFGKLALGGGKGNFLHYSQSSFSSCQPST